MTFSSWIASIFARDRSEDEHPGPSGGGFGPRSADDNELEDGNPPPTLSELVLGGRYQLEFLIGRGSSAVVYRAQDQVLDQKVAIKVLLLDGIGMGEQSERIAATLRDECRAAMRLSHPHILRVYNYERSGTWEYVVMEYVVGENLSQLVRRRTVHRLSPRELVRYGCETLDALEYAHGLGVVHNDVKPANLLLTRPGGVKICDFGLARMSGMGWESALAGTPAYMSPERIRGEEGDARSDLYSLAATLFMLGNGQTLFGTRVDEALDGHLRLPAPSASHLPPAVHEVLVKALAKDPDDRWPDAASMSTALRNADHMPTQTARLRPVRGPLPTAPEGHVPKGRKGHGRVVAVTPMPPSRISIPSKVPEPIAPPQLLATPAPPPPRTPRLPPPPPGMVSVVGSGVRAFAIERHPVTCHEYAEYLVATRAKPPLGWNGTSPPFAEPRPVVNITLEEARAYANWRGRRLPTKAEWLAAARGPRRTAFPWGDDWEPERCVGPESKLEQPSPVGGRPQGAAECGAEDLLGNVWEWTEPTPGPDRPEAGRAMILGGSYRHVAAKDGEISCTSVHQLKRYDFVGFRCAADLWT